MRLLIWTLLVLSAWASLDRRGLTDLTKSLTNKAKALTGTAQGFGNRALGLTGFRGHTLHNLQSIADQHGTTLDQLTIKRIDIEVQFVSENWLGAKVMAQTFIYHLKDQSGWEYEWQTLHGNWHELSAAFERREVPYKSYLDFDAQEITMRWHDFQQEAIVRGMPLQTTVSIRRVPLQEADRLSRGHATGVCYSTADSSIPQPRKDLSRRTLRA